MGVRGKGNVRALSGKRIEIAVMTLIQTIREMNINMAWLKKLTGVF
jgi:hypothetical protein